MDKMAGYELLYSAIVFVLDVTLFASHLDHVDQRKTLPSRTHGQ